ncbi:hypothetical protein AVEN_166022-1 [Araneus ventricosus]|uniref:Uncharacterized protein n=1 Tax=Araneus ventricosus TaxID=182803 RepID=A0A4Y2L5Q9_ARAVE|nr:hypothetical protein AVEN_166022-1 [Araneus ventricosus]
MGPHSAKNIIATKTNVLYLRSCRQRVGDPKRNGANGYRKPTLTNSRSTEGSRLIFYPYPPVAVFPIAIFQSCQWCANRGRHATINEKVVSGQTPREFINNVIKEVVNLADAKRPSVEQKKVSADAKRPLMIKEGGICQMPLTINEQVITVRRQATTMIDAVSVRCQATTMSKVITAVRTP